MLGDALEFLRALRDASADIVFLDPPFNLGKTYGSRKGRMDRLAEPDYIAFMRDVLAESSRVLKPGGALYLYHIPSWALRLAPVLSETLTFQHWIAISMKNGFVRRRSLYPAHYALLFFTRGKPAHFRRPKVRPSMCPHCGELTKDYGGYLHLVEAGVNLSDVWEDVSPVRHRKARSANEMPIRIPTRAIDISGRTNGVVVDPFAGSGTTLIAARARGMRFIGCDIESESVAIILDRLSSVPADSKGGSNGT